MQRHVQGPRDSVLAAVLVAGQEDGEALLEARRVGFAQHAHNLGVGEPFRDVLAGAEAGAELSAADVENSHAVRDLVVGLVLVAVGEVDHLLEGDDFDAQFLPVLLDGVLGVVRAVEVFAGAVLAGAGVVAADDEVRGAVVLADDGVPDRLPRSTHAHGQREQTQDGHAVGVAREQRLVNPHPGEVVDVAGFGQADDGVDEDVGLAGPGGADCQFSVGPMHGVAGLKGNNARPAKLFEMDPELGRSVAKSDIVIVVQSRDGINLAAHVIVLNSIVQVFDCWMLWVSTEYFLGLFLSVLCQNTLLKKKEHRIFWLTCRAYIHHRW